MLVDIFWQKLPIQIVVADSVANSKTKIRVSVTDSDFVLKSSNKLATGILNGYEHIGAVQTFLNQPWAYLNSTNFI